jgi:glycosyltransferase involved in cell wall biosynthesis
MHRAAVTLRRRFPGLVSQAIRAIPTVAATKRDVDERMAASRRVFSEVDLFVAPSRSIAEEFQRLGVDAAKIRISDYGFVPLLRNARNGNDGARRPIRIGYVGTLVWHKGVHILLDAVRRLPSNAYELKIFGNPDVFPDYTADLRATAAGLPVKFMGAFDREQIAEVYAQMDVLVVPSLWLENSPLVIHEAFMAGIPVVGARIGGIVDLVADGVTGVLYDPTSSSALQAAIGSLIENPPRLNDLAECARRVARVKSIVEDAREWERTYVELIQDRAAGPLPT